MPNQSVSFDRAVDFYDRTRELPADLARAQTELLTAELRSVDGPALEIGVGTGRVALPLAASGCRVVGLDLSAGMLGRLREKDPDRTVPVVRGDAGGLPFPADTFGAAVVCHVLHLVADWVGVVDELVRVLRPGGVMLVTRGAAREGVMAEVVRRVRSEWGPPSGPERADRLDRLDELDTYLAAQDATVEHLAPLEEKSGAATRSVGDYLDQTAAGVYSWTWEADPVRLQAALASARAWVQAQYGDPAQVPAPQPPIRWHRYRLRG